jgi:hypothetical protein
MILIIREKIRNLNVGLPPAGVEEIKIAGLTN